MIVFLDSSALVKRFTVEPGSRQVEQTMASEMIGISGLAFVEVGSALSRRYREGLITESEQLEAIASLNQEAKGFFVVDLSTLVIQEAQRLVLRNSGLRAGDALQLSSFFALQNDLEVEVDFLSFDHRLNEIAQSLGLPMIPLDQEA